MPFVKGDENINRKGRSGPNKSTEEVKLIINQIVSKPNLLIIMLIPNKNIIVPHRSDITNVFF